MFSKSQTGYGYDALGRLSTLTSSAGNFGYSYQGNTDRIAQLLMPNGAKTTYSYTALGELDVLQNVAANNSNISRYDYNTDARGVRTALQEQIEADPVKTLMFSYDPANQLTGEQVTGGKTGEAYNASYQYDASGNRTRFEKTTSTKNEVTRTSGNKLNQTLASTSVTNGGAASTAGFTYDEAGNMAQASSSGGKSDYAFDDASRLTSIVKRDGAGVALSKSEFAYDGMSRLRISREFDYVGGAWVARGEKRRIYDGLNAVQERDGNGALVATYTRGMDMGGGIGGLLCRTFASGKSFMHYDGRGNVVQLSDVSGAVSGKYTYDAFGNTLSVSGGAAGLNPYRFSTKEQVGGLVYYGYRFYSPSMGKWINRDPMAERGGVNLYGFAFNNSISRVDSYGLMSYECASAIFLAVGATSLALAAALAAAASIVVAGAAISAAAAAVASVPVSGGLTLIGAVIAVGAAATATGTAIRNITIMIGLGIAARAAIEAAMKECCEACQDIDESKERIDDLEREIERHRKDEAESRKHEEDQERRLRELEKKMEQLQR